MEHQPYFDNTDGVRVNEDSETSSEDLHSSNNDIIDNKDDRVQKMAKAFRTIIEVSNTSESTSITT